MVGVRAKRGISLVMITMVFLLKTISSSANTAAAAAVYKKSNNNDTACCLIADELESEFLMDSEIRRMLGAQISPGTLAKDKSSADCGRGKTVRPIQAAFRKRTEFSRQTTIVMTLITRTTASAGLSLLKIHHPFTVCDTLCV